VENGGNLIDFNINPVDDFGMQVMQNMRALKNLVEALQTRIHKQDAAINNMANEVKGLKEALTAMRNMG